MQHVVAALIVVLATGCALPGAPLARGEWVRGRAELYELRTPDPGWRKLAASDGETDLELEQSAGRRLIVHVYDRSETTVDDLVNTRRKSILENVEVDTQSERRELLAGADLVAVTWAQYEVSSGGARGSYAIAIADTGERLIELVAFDLEPERGELGSPRLRRLVRSLRLVPVPAEEGAS